jgi:hypothetical protein
MAYRGFVRRSGVGVAILVVVASTEVIGAGTASAGTTGSFAVDQNPLEVGASTSVTLTVDTTAGDPLPSRVFINVDPASTLTLSSVESTGPLIGCILAASSVTCDWEQPAAGGQTGTVTFTATAAEEGSAALNASFLPVNDEVPETLATAEVDVVPVATTSPTTATTTSTTTTTTAPTSTTAPTATTTTAPAETSTSAPTTTVVATSPASGTLPPTGWSSGGAAAMGALALALGVMLVALARLRRRDPA